MAHFAKIDSQTNIVLEVNVVNNDDIQNLPFPESESIGIAFLKLWNTPNTYWKQTSYNNNFRKNYAGVGDTYDESRDAFIAPKPYPSWLLDEDKAQWKAPVDHPTDESGYVWNEETLVWDAVEMVSES
jgi:hypothetical protein